MSNHLTLIPKYEDYAVSTNGEVWSHLSNKWLKQQKSHRGYMMTALRHDGGYFNAMVHRLVAQTYIPNPSNLAQVNHIDGDKTNNNVSNLEWCTSSQNHQHAHRIGLFKNIAKGEATGHTHLTAEDIPVIRKRYSNGESSGVIALDYPVHSNTILQVVRRRTWKHV